MQARRSDGSLEAWRPYRIKGVNWAPASRASGVDDRQAQYAVWHATDIPLIKAMNANTVRVFLDFGVGALACAVLDELYRHNIMVIVTADKMVNDTQNVTRVVNAYKNHPAVLMWSLGNEWNINLYFGTFPNVDLAAQATEAAAQQIKALDTNHPVASSFGDIDIPGLAPLGKTREIVNNVVLSADAWGLNVFRGPTFGSLFQQWASIASKPMFIGEFGTDAFSQISATEDQVLQGGFDVGLWQDIGRNLSADDPAHVSLGGCIFEWNDEWWKAGNPSVHDFGGFPSSGHPDGFSNEEWFGIVDVDRNPRRAFFAFQSAFGGPEVGLITNQSAFRPAERMHLDIFAGNAGTAAAVDAYIGALLPAGAVAGCSDGTSMLFLASGFRAVLVCLRDSPLGVEAFVRDVVLPVDLPIGVVSDFLVFDWPEGASPGTYTFFIALTRTGTFEVLASAVTPITFAP